MELILLGLAGLGGLALLLQSKPLPSKDDAEKAFAVLDKDPTDPDANTVFGKYKAFVQGDYDAAMPYLVHSKDTTLKTLAEHELDSTHTATPPQKVGMGDEWVAAAKKFPPLSRIFYDRASQWYMKGWPDLDKAWKDKARQQGRKLAASRPPGVSGTLPTGWTPGAGMGGTPSTKDGTVARTGSYSAKVSPGDPKNQTSYSEIKGEMVPVRPGDMIELSVYAMTDGADGGADRIELAFSDQGGTSLQFDKAYLPVDMPFWTRVSIKAKAPDRAARAQFAAYFSSRNGNLWLDDLSMKINDKDVALKNPSLENK